jgi:hypothetical protein
MRVGIVGVGKWGSVLAKKVKECGAHVAAYERLGLDTMPGLGTKTVWMEMLAHHRVDALVVAATPAVSYSVASACIELGFPALVSKPLMFENNIIGLKAPLYVDYVHLFSMAWPAFSVACDRLANIDRVDVTFAGNGPVREFSGLHDYAPHAVSMIADALNPVYLKVEYVDVTSSKPGRKLYAIHGSLNEVVPFTVTTGNDAPEGKRKICVTYKDGTKSSYEEVQSLSWIKEDTYYDGVADVRGDQLIAYRHDPLMHLVRSYLEDVLIKRCDLKWFEISRMSTQFINDTLALENGND